MHRPLILSTTTVLLAALAVRSGTAASQPQDAPAAPGELTASVEPRVELLSLVFRLAGNPEYNPPNVKSPYLAAVDGHFGGFHDHAVVKLARQLRNEHGVSYDAVMSMAAHIADLEQGTLKIPLAQKPERLDARWPAAGTQRFLELLAEFVAQTDFVGFVAKQRALYDEAGQRMRAQLAKGGYRAWFDGFFGEKPAARFHVVVSLLNGGNCYGVGVRYADGREEITPVIGAWKFDQAGVPVFDDSFTGTIVHEFCHSYTNPLVDKHAERLRPAAERIWAHRQSQMQRQAYGNWKTMLYESLVRACCVRYAYAQQGSAAGERAAAYEHSHGFTWTTELAVLLSEYETQRDRYATLDAFMPRIVAFFEEHAQSFAAQPPEAPRVVSIVPENGAQAVDPGLKAIVVTFDRPMADGWSVVGGGPHYPELAGDISYDRAMKVLTIPVRLKPGWEYVFGLNSVSFQNFRSRAGVPLEPVVVRFATRRE